MAETKNYKLSLETNDSTKFKQWRERINLGAGSDMQKIEDALTGKADGCVYDEEAGTLQLTSLGEPITDPIEVGAGTWGAMDDLIE